MDRTTKCFCEIAHLIGRILFCENSFDGQNNVMFLHGTVQSLLHELSKVH
jgi:hypothetical protein